MFVLLLPQTPQWGAADAEVKVPSDENTVGQYIAMHATLTARNFFLANFYPSGPFTCIFSKTSSRFFPVLVAANTGSCEGPQNKVGHPAGCMFLCLVLREYK